MEQSQAQVCCDSFYLESNVPIEHMKHCGRPRCVATHKKKMKRKKNKCIFSTNTHGHRTKYKKQFFRIKLICMRVADLMQLISFN